MRAGHLRHVAELVDGFGHVLARDVRVGIRDVDASIGQDDGLFSAASITIRARWRDDFIGGYLLKVPSFGDYVISGASNPDGVRRDAIISVRKVIGSNTVVQTSTVSVHASVDLEIIRAEAEGAYHFIDDAQIKTRATFLSAQYQPWVGDVFSYGQVHYEITEIDTKKQTPGLVSCWVKKV